MKENNNNHAYQRIPSFNELKELVSKYEIYVDENNPYNIGIKDIKTGELLLDKPASDRAMFANLWLSAAGLKYMQGETRQGETYAFNEEAEKLYNIICNELQNDCKNKHVIDTVNLLKNVSNSNGYKYSEEIIVNLFRTPYQTEMINRLFLQSQNINRCSQKPEALYSMSYAGDLAFGEENNVRGR